MHVPMEKARVKNGTIKMGKVVGILIVAVLGCMGSACAQSVVRTSKVCPPKFTQIGRKCYYFSKDEATWQDAHFICGTLTENGTLAIVNNAQQELLMRRYLNKYRSDLGNHERWIGGIFNWKKTIWEWGATGQPLSFHAFSRMNARLRDVWKWHCTIIDPAHQNKWSARLCVLRRRYVCQSPSSKPLTTKQRIKKNYNGKDCGNAPRSEGCRNQNHSMAGAPGFLAKKPPKKAKKHYIYSDFICPPHMILVGRQCYYFSTEPRHWNDAYWACRDNRTKLAIINHRMQDNILRGFLNNNFVEHRERWIGGMYDQKQEVWKWAMNGRPLKYRNFAEDVLEMSKEHIYDCITMDPYYQHRWNARNRFELKHYICQVKPKTMIKKERPIKLKPPDATVVIHLADDSKYGRAKKSALNAPTVATYLDNRTSETGG